MDWNNRIIESVINVSAGRNYAVINNIVAAISSLDRVTLLHCDSGWDADRTVFTVIGELDAVFKAVYKMFIIAADKIDMAQYLGNHPAIGSVDVVPFVPIKNISKEELQKEIHHFGMQISDEFKLPIIFYGSMATQKRNVNLSSIRKGGFRTLKKRINEKQLLVDGVESIAHSKMGATCWTVRDFMLAYNINLKTENLGLTKRIAADIRKERETTSSLQNVKVLGWATPHFNCCQISTNIYDLSEMTMSGMYDFVKIIANKYNVDVEGSELIGMTPLKGFNHAADFDNFEEYGRRLRLDSVVEFDPEKRILEILLKLNKNLF